MNSPIGVMCAQTDHHYKQ